MSTYLGKYTIKAFEFGFGGWKPYDDKKEYCFDSTNEKDARRIADEHRRTIARELFGAVVTLDTILEVKQVKTGSTN